MKFKFYDEDFELKFIIDKYVRDNSTYIEAVVMENGNPIEPFGYVTTCIPFSTMEEDEVVLDTNNSGELIKEMKKQKLIKLTDRTVSSGFCVYPIGKLTKKFYTESLREVNI